MRAGQCIVASGAFDQPVIFRNNDLPGVMLTSDAQRLIKLYAVKPGTRAVLLTGNDDGYLAALDLLEAGVEVAALVDMRDAPADATLLEVLEARGIACQLGSTVYEAQHEKGMRHISGVDIRRIVDKGEVASQGLRLDCDLLCMSAGYMPAYQLLCQAGGKLSYEDSQATFSLSGLPAGLRAAGSVNGYSNLKNVLLDGAQAARQAASGLGIDPAAPISGGFVAEAQVNFPGRSLRTPRARNSSISTRTCRSATSSTPRATATAMCSWSSASPRSAWGRRRAATRHCRRRAWWPRRPTVRSARLA